LQDLGLDSLMGVELRNYLSRRLTYRLPVAVFSGNPTLDDVIRYLASAVVRPGATSGATDGRSKSPISEVVPSDAPVGPLHTTFVELVGEPARLFCFPPASGEAISLAPLGQALGSWPMTVIEVELERAISIDELSARIARDVRKFQAHGPYHLIGHSLGGVLAHTITSDLEREGEKVALVCAIESAPPPFGLLPNPIDLLGLVFDEHLHSALLALDTSERNAARSKYDGRHDDECYLEILQWSKQRRIFTSRIGTEAALDRMRRVRTIFELFRTYTPKPVTADFISITARNAYPLSEGSWRELSVGHYTEVVVSGNHLSCMQAPAVAGVAEVLRTRLLSPLPRS
jgi:thioesterase domain-containing protein